MLIVPVTNKISYSEGHKCQLLEDAQFVIPSLVKFGRFKSPHVSHYDGLLTIHKGYAWDGFTVGTRGSLVRDVLYQLMRVGKIPGGYRKTADQIFLELCVKDGTPSWRIKLLFWTLGRFRKKGGLIAAL
jgi:hypothetical protein